MLSYVFLNKCVACGCIQTDGKPVCDSCKKTLYRITGIRCEYCGREILHCSCLRRRNIFSRNISVYRYDGSASNIVKRFKIGKLTQLAVYISSEMSILIKEEYGDIKFDCMTFVPSSRFKDMRRGFSHTKLIADRISNDLKIPNLSLLKRKFGTKEQKGQSARNRVINVRDKYRAVRDVSGMKILLIDDVITTGSSLNECARMLKKAGASEVFCATFASTYKK